MRIFSTTLYNQKGFGKIIQGLVEVCDPEVVVELGTQQGASAVLIGRALGHGTLYTYDSFKPVYDLPPHAATHADQALAEGNIHDAHLEHKVFVIKKNAFKVHNDYRSVDILHIDIGNHYGNMVELLPDWYDKVTKAMILEGGIHNTWQKACGFKSYESLLGEPFIVCNYDRITIAKDNKYALTICMRKQ